MRKGQIAAQRSVVFDNVLQNGVRQVALMSEIVDMRTKHGEYAVEGDCGEEQMFHFLFKSHLISLF